MLSSKILAQTPVFIAFFPFITIPTAKSGLKESFLLIGKKTESKKVTTNIPAILNTLLKNNKKAFENFLLMPPSHQKVYLNYITEAKKVETQMRRAEKVIEMILNKSI